MLSLQRLRSARSRALVGLAGPVPEEARAETLRLIDAALAVAAREACEAREAREARAHTPDTGDARLPANFARDIRAGAFDQPGKAREEVRRQLLDQVLADLAVWNPDYLTASGIGETPRKPNPGPW